MNLFSDFSLLWIVPMAVFAFGLSALFYLWKSKNTQFTKRIKYILFSLRGLGFLLILILFLGILFQSTQYRPEKPLLIVAMDGSSSMLNYSDSLSVKTELPTKLNTVLEQLSSKFDIKKITFSDQISDTLDYRFDAKATNISLPIATIRQNYLNKNLGAILLISDGNYNEGINPLFETEKLNFTPVFAVAIGDTIVKRDASISELTVNQIAFSGNLFPVKVDITAHKLKDATGKLSLYINNKRIKEESVTINGASYAQSFTFQVEAVGKGIQSVRVELQINAKEYTLSNNVRTAYIEVLDSKRKVDIIAGGIHPDIGALQSVLQKEKNTEVKVHLANNLTSIPQSDLIIFHNPSANLALWKQLNESNTAFLAILSAEADPSSLGLGLSGYVNGKKDMVLPALNSDFTTIQFSSEIEKRMKDFPPLTVPYVRNTKEIGSSVLFQKIGNVISNRPLLTFMDKGDVKAAVLYGEGIWRWKLSEYNRYQDNTVFDAFFGKTLQYLTVKKNTDKLRIFSPLKSSERESIVFKAELYNDAFQLITDSDISFQLMDNANVKIADYVFQPNKKDYSLNLERLRAGVYKWKAKTTVGGKLYEKTGELIVAESTLESLSLSSNFGLMHEIATQTKGQFFTLDNWDLLYETLTNREDITSVSYQEISFTNIMDYKWLFFVIILLFSMEWGIRRWYGSY